MTTILIAERQARISSFLEKGLRAEGFGTEVTRDGVQALSLARSGRYALLILDLGLLGLDGTEVLRAIRGEGQPLPILVLTSRNGVDDETLSVGRGTNEYLTKPFRFDELLERVRRLLRQDAAGATGVLHAGDATLDIRAGRLLVDGGSVPLRDRELDLAHVFFRRAGQVVTKAELLNEVWGFDFDPGTQSVDAHVNLLRRKLGPERITRVRRVGYRLETSAPARSESRRHEAAARPW